MADREGEKVPETDLYETACHRRQLLNSAVSARGWRVCPVALCALSQPCAALPRHCAEGAALPPAWGRQACRLEFFAPLGRISTVRGSVYGFFSVRPSTRMRARFVVVGISPRSRPRAAPIATAAGDEPLERVRYGAKSLSGGHDPIVVRSQPPRLECSRAAPREPWVMVDATTT